MQYQCYANVRVERNHSEPTEDGKGTRLVSDPATTERVLVTIDVDKIIATYGPRACRAKTRKTRQLNGMVVLKAQ